ncbi:peptidoglycan-binding domain-containing protein [Streptomyces sp. b94]|uniref:peptidoglycan-binding domain-containing protein n=1 Tax=Streptomyces sp. b94 TaxID=1827634 RepID=UPI0027B95DA5|nr:peptidoglycan-binding domain-containing protein [Streptomyces sp. b94]
MMTGHACPECGRQAAGEPGAGYGTPCWCGAGTGPARTTPDGRWAAPDDHRADRTVEIAPVDDFDPLRVRPYVSLPDAAHTPEAGSASPSAMAGAAPTTPLYLGGDSGPYPGAGTAVGAGAEPVWGPGVEPGTAHTEPGGRHRRTPGSAPAPVPTPAPSQRQRPFVVLAAAAAVAAVVGTAAFAGGLFGGAEDRTDEALPETTTSVPDAEDGPAASVAPSPSASAAAPRTPSASATASASPSASASPKEKSQEPTPTGSASASASASASPGRSPSATPGGDTPTEAPTAEQPPPAIAAGTLRPGDRGPQVAELQNRLREIGRWLYSGPSDGDYTDRVAYSVAYYQSYMGVHGDPTGVYGPNTRKLLEAQTSGRDRDHGRGHGRGHR